MAPPSYSDLGKKCRDLLSKNYNPGTAKFEVTTKAQNGMKFVTNGQMELESGKSLHAVEMTATCADHGLKYVEKWSTDNQLVVDMSVEDKILQGLKTSFISCYNPTTNKKKGTVKASYKNEHINANTDVDLDYAGPCIKAAAVAGYKGWLGGYQMGFDSSKKKLTANNFSLSYAGGRQACHLAVNNGQDLSGSYFYECGSGWLGGVSADFSTATKAMVGNVGTQYSTNDTVLKAKVSTEGQIALGLKTKLCTNVNLGLSAMLDGKNFSAGGHRVGMSVDFEH